MYHRRILIYALTAILYLQAGAAEPKLWLDFKNAQKSGKESILPDFSWAGYHYSEKAIPHIKRRVFKVTSYGAIPNDDKYDDKAVQKALKAAEVKGGGVVLFPPGRFKFCPKEGLEHGIQITSSNIVLRGAGSGDKGTELFIDKMNTKNGSSYFLVAPPKAKSTKLATIVASAKRESHVLKVNNSSALKVGQTVVIIYKGKDFVKRYFAPQKASSNWTRLFEGGMSIHE